MEEEKFPVIFLLSQLTQGEKEWLYYTKTLTNWKHYTETFKQSSAEETEQWLIKFDELPTYIPFPLDKAKMARKNEEDLTIELDFQPVRVEKKVNPDITHYTLEVKLITTKLKDVDEILYVATESVQ